MRNILLVVALLVAVQAQNDWIDGDNSASESVRVRTPPVPTSVASDIFEIPGRIDLTLDTTPEHDDDDDCPPSLGPCVPNGVFYRCKPSYTEMVDRLFDILADSHGLVTLGSAGLSFQNRKLWWAKVGTGSLSYWFTGAVHGNECANTKPLLDLLEYLAGSSTRARRIRKELTVYITPIYNPDGYVANTRQNAQGIDLNRDWCVDPQPNTTVLPCDPVDGRYLAPESNRWFEFYRAKRPDIVLDVHQYQGRPIRPDTKQFIEAQPVVFPYNQAGNEKTMFRSLQQAEVILRSILDEDRVPGRWDITGPSYTPLHSATSRMYDDGRRMVTDSPYVPLASLGVEFRRVCPGYETRLWDFIFQVLKDQVWFAATGEMFKINPVDLVYLPFQVEMNCTIPCPAF